MCVTKHCILRRGHRPGTNLNINNHPHQLSPVDVMYKSEILLFHIQSLPDKPPYSVGSEQNMLLLSLAALMKELQVLHHKVLPYCTHSDLEQSALHYPSNTQSSLIRSGI